MARQTIGKSRRTFIRASGAWAAAVSLPALMAAEEKDRALVCVYLMVGGSDVELAGANGLNPALSGIGDLYSAGVAAIVNKVSAPSGSGVSPDARYGTLRFQPGGSFTQQWASPAGASVTTLPSGLTLAGLTFADSAALAATAATASFQTQFPATGIGSQLRDAAALLRMRKSFGLTRPVFTAALSGFRLGQADVNNRILADLGSALSAFYGATLELNISKDVTTFTDMDFGPGPAGGRSQIVMGGSVRGGRLYAGGPATAYEDYTVALSRWHSAAPSSGSNPFIGFLY